MSWYSVFSAVGEEKSTTAAETPITAARTNPTTVSIVVTHVCSSSIAQSATIVSHTAPGDGTRYAGTSSRHATNHHTPNSARSTRAGRHDAAASATSLAP